MVQSPPVLPRRARDALNFPGLVQSDPSVLAGPRISPGAPNPEPSHQTKLLVNTKPKVDPDAAKAKQQKEAARAPQQSHAKAAPPTKLAGSGKPVWDKPHSS